MNNYQQIDLSYMDLMTDNEPSLKITMLEILFHEPIVDIEKMISAHEEKDWTELKSVSHKMKSSLSFVGCNQLTEVNEEIERITKEQSNLEKLTGLLSSLKSLYDSALIELKEEHQKLQSLIS